MLWAQNRAEPRAQAVLKKMAGPGAILHLPARVFGDISNNLNSETQNSKVNGALDDDTIM